MLDLTELFKKHERPWWIDDNRAPLEGQVFIYDANGQPVLHIGDMEDVEGWDLQLAELVVWASRHVLTTEREVDPKEYWKRPFVLEQENKE